MDKHILVNTLSTNNVLISTVEKPIKMNILNNFVLQEVASLPDEEHPDISYVIYDEKLVVLYVTPKSKNKQMAADITDELRSKFLEAIIYNLSGDFRQVINQVQGNPIYDKYGIDYDNPKQFQNINIPLTYNFIIENDRNRQVSVILEIRSKIGSSNIVDDMETFSLYITVGEDRHFVFELADDFILDDRYRTAMWRLIYNVFYYNHCRVVGYGGLLTIPFGNGTMQIGILESLLSALPLTSKLPDAFDRQYQVIDIGDNYRGYMLKSELWGNVDGDGSPITQSYAYSHMDADAFIRTVTDGYINTL